MNCHFLSLSPPFASSSSSPFLLVGALRSCLAEAASSSSSSSSTTSTYRACSSSLTHFQNDKTKKKTIPMVQNGFLYPTNATTPISSTQHLIVRARRRKGKEGVEHEHDGDVDGGGSVAVQVGEAKGSGTTARGRRLLKVREEKRKREYDRIHNYPTWAKVLEDACKDDTELRAVLGDSIGNPELMRERVQQRVRQKGPDFRKSKTGSVVAFKVSFRDFNPLDSHIWFELYGAPSDRDVDLIGSVIQSWYVMGRLGAFNSSNLQLANSSMEHNPLYDADKGFKVMPSSFHDISDVEFQDNWGRVWVDLGTCDFFAVDVLLNCLTVLSSEYLGIKQVVFGGRRMGDWEEGMTSTEDGYKYFKI